MRAAQSGPQSAPGPARNGRAAPPRAKRGRRYEGPLAGSERLPRTACAGAAVQAGRGHSGAAGAAFDGGYHRRGRENGRRALHRHPRPCHAGAWRCGPWLRAYLPVFRRRVRAGLWKKPAPQAVFARDGPQPQPVRRCGHRLSHHAPYKRRQPGADGREHVHPSCCARAVAGHWLHRHGLHHQRADRPCVPCVHPAYCAGAVCRDAQNSAHVRRNPSRAGRHCTPCGRAPGGRARHPCVRPPEGGGAGF